MIDNLETALIITAIGMGLVFSAIALLWILMAVLVKVAADRDLQNKASPAPEPDESHHNPKAIAAIVAVAIALARDVDAEPHEFPLPPTALVSAWQSVMRSDMIKRRVHIK